MITRFEPRKMIYLGAIMVILGVVVPFGMVLDMIPRTIFLSFLSYVFQLGGLIIGIIGAATIAVNERD